MTLFDKSLKLALLASVALLTACPDKEADDTAVPADADTDTDADTDADTDTDTDTDADADTGVAQFYFLADFTTDGAGAYVDANFGYGMFGIVDQDWACSVLGNMPYVGEASAGCPDCDWAFDLGAVEGSVAEGPYCDQFFEDGYVDGSNDYEWGFSDVYYYDYEGTPLALENVIHLQYEGDWIQFAFNYGGRDWVTGDATASSVARPISNNGAYIYYYYYR
ncbi:MAG: hypothetical protein Q7U06_01350 [Pseudomonadota bacterium]|nr:hypothetical protein [Pseudomonadota bacterium]